MKDDGTLIELHARLGADPGLEPAMRDAPVLDLITGDPPCPRTVTLRGPTR